MDGHRRGFCESSGVGKANAEHERSRDQQGARNCHPQNTSSSTNEAASFCNPSLAAPYGLAIPGVGYESLPYSSVRRPSVPILQIPHGIPSQTGYQPALAGLNQINPVLLLSSNDNNNCNSRARAASHSTVFEMRQHGALGIPYHIPTAQRHYLLPDLPSNIFPNIGPSSYRRNSTNTSLPQDVSPSPAHRIQNLLPPPYDRPPPPYPSAANIQTYSHQDALRRSLTSTVHYRRGHFSVGGALATTDGMNSMSLLQRRNSIPTALEVQVSEENGEDMSPVEDEDDDVFDPSPPLTAPHSATDAASYLEQLRESRKRPSTGVPDLTRPKCVRQEEQQEIENFRPRRPRFRRCVTDVDQNASDEQKSRKRHGVHAEHLTPSVSDKPSTSRHLQQVQTDDDVKEISRPAESTKQSDAVMQNGTSRSIPSSSLVPERSTASPNPILKNSRPKKILLKRSNLTPESNKQDSVDGNFSKGQSSSKNASSTPDIPKSKSLPIKKQVAWKDHPKINEPSNIKSRVIMTPMKHDLLSEHSLVQVKNDPNSMTEKDKMGPFIFGPRMGTSPVKSLTQYLVRKENTLKYYLAKVLHMGGNTSDDNSGRLLLYSEHSLLTFLKNHPGVIREHGLYKDVAYDAKSGKVYERVCLILECLTPHEFDPATKDCLVLQKHVMKVGRLPEREAIHIFTLILNIVHSLHELNVVHRDLKLENMVLMEKCQRVVLTNFCLGRHLMSDDDLLRDRRGSPAYISPDVLSCQPYAGKPSDMWSLGVVLYMMLYGQFPFYDKDPMQLFKKIQKADFSIPSQSHVTTQINDVIRGLLTLDPTQRLTSGETLLALQQYISARNLYRCSNTEIQVVPDIDNGRDSSSDSDSDKMDEVEQQKMEEELTREFRLKLLSDDEDASPAKNRGKAFGRSSYQSTLPIIQHCPYDARPLTQEEIAMHHRLLVNSTLGVRVQSSSQPASQP